MNKIFGVFLFAVLLSLMFFSVGVQADAAACDYDGDGLTGDCVPNGGDWTNPPSGPGTCDCCEFPPHHTSKYGNVPAATGYGSYTNKCIVNPSQSAENVACEVLYSYENVVGGGWCGAFGGCEGGSYTAFVADRDLSGRYTYGCGENQICFYGQCVSCSGTFESTEALCQDGIDNDCDGFIDCEDANCASQPNCGGSTIPVLGAVGPSFIVNTSDSVNYEDGVFFKIGSNGVLEVVGYFTGFEENVFTPSLSPTEINFVVKNSTRLSPYSTNVFTTNWFEGRISMQGQIHQYVPDYYLNAFETNSEQELIVKNSVGDIVAVFDGRGNLYLRKYVKY